MIRDLPEIKRVCIFGTGGVGGYYAGKIAEKVKPSVFPEHELYFIARGEHLQAIKLRGITVKTPERTISGRPAAATGEISEIPSPDLILLCVKSYDLADAVKSMRSGVSDKTIIIPLLNGIDIYERIREKLDKGIILPACVYLGTHIESPGVINQNGGNGIILLGPDHCYPHFSGENVKTFFTRTGIDFTWLPDSRPAIWEKYLFIAAFGLVTACTGMSLGGVLENRESCEMVRCIMEEILGIARKKGINMPENSVEKSIEKACSFPCDARTSYQRDIENKRSLNEGELYGGTILREGEALGIATPVTKAVYRKIG